MALTNVYVNPAIAGNSGTGTIGDPYGDLQYGFNTHARDAVNGNRFNVKSGVAEVMSAPIDLTIFGIPTNTAPLVIQGYDTIAEDGGIGEINNGGANVSIINSGTYNNIAFVDMKLGNTGTAQILALNQYISLIRCEFHLSSAANAVQFTANGGNVIACSFHDLTGNVPLALSSTRVIDSYFEYGVSGQYATSQVSVTMSRCIFNLADGARGANLGGNGTGIEFCTFYSVGGTGIALNNISVKGSITNCLFVGFSGVGGVAISGGTSLTTMGHNAFYNNTTDISGTPVVSYRLPDLILTYNPLLNVAGNNFDIASALKNQGWPTNFNYILTPQCLDIGAVQSKPFDMRKLHTHNREYIPPNF